MAEQRNQVSSIQIVIWVFLAIWLVLYVFTSIGFKQPARLTTPEEDEKRREQESRHEKAYYDQLERNYKGRTEGRQGHPGRPLD